MFHVRVMDSSSFYHVVFGALCLLALAGCHGEEPVLPDEPDPQFWASYRDGEVADGSLVDGSLADAASPGLCSEQNGQGTAMRVVNTTAGPVASYWVDFECNERPYQTIPAGESRDQMSFVGHVWRFRGADGRLIRQVVLEETPLQEVEL